MISLHISAKDNFIEEEDEDVTNSWAVTTTATESSYKSKVSVCTIHVCLMLSC